MVYSQMIIADDNVVRFWSACQLARPQLLGVELKPVACFDTFSSALSDVTDKLDLVLLSVMTGFIIDEGAATDVRGSCRNVLEAVFQPIYTAAKKSSNVQVIYLNVLGRFFNFRMVNVVSRILCLFWSLKVIICLLQFFVAPPERCPIPRWFSTNFVSVYEIFSDFVKSSPSNVHVLPLYPAQPTMFDLDGRHFMTAFGKDFLDHLLNGVESGMIQVLVFEVIFLARLKPLMFSNILMSILEYLPLFTNIVLWFRFSWFWRIVLLSMRTVSASLRGRWFSPVMILVLPTLGSTIWLLVMLRTVILWPTRGYYTVCFLFLYRLDIFVQYNCNFIAFSLMVFGIKFLCPAFRLGLCPYPLVYSNY